MLKDHTTGNRRKPAPTPAAKPIVPTAWDARCRDLLESRTVARIGPPAFAVYALLFNRADGDGVARLSPADVGFPVAASVGKMLGLEAAAVMAAVETLKDNLLVREEHGDGWTLRLIPPAPARD